MPTYSPYVQERWELVEYVNSTVLADVAQPVWRESSAAGGLADVYGLSRLSTSGGSENLAIADTYLEDGLGSVSAVLREGGAVAASLSYSPWGEEELATESLPGYGDRFERPTTDTTSSRRPRREACSTCAPAGTTPPWARSAAATRCWATRPTRPPSTATPTRRATRWRAATRRGT